MELTAPFYPREFRCKDTIKDENHQTKTEENFPFSTTFTSAKNKKFSKRKAIKTDYQILTFFTSSKSFPKVKPKRKLRRFFKKILAKYMKQNQAERNRLSEDGQKDTKSTRKLLKAVGTVFRRKTSLTALNISSRAALSNRRVHAKKHLCLRHKTQQSGKS